MKVIVLAGGDSDEREVSLRSGTAVANALKTAGHEVNTLDPTGDLMAMLPELKAADVIFPALHGKGGEDGSLQIFLEEHVIKYVGSNGSASTLCFDKARYIELLNKHDINVPETKLVDMEEYKQSTVRGKPFVLKPNDGGSSIDTFIVREPAGADEQKIQEAFGRHRKLLLQPLIEGIEITVAVLSGQALPVIEIIPPANGEFDYENKYNGRTQELCPPSHVSQQVQQQAQRLAKEIHELTGCRDMSRTDMIVADNSQLYVLETNTIPGLTEESLLPKAAAAAGLEMPVLCTKLINGARSH